MGLAVTGCPWGRCGAQSPVGQRRTRGGSRRKNTTGRRGRPADLRPAEPIPWAPMMSRLGRRKHVAITPRCPVAHPPQPTQKRRSTPKPFFGRFHRAPNGDPPVGHFSAVFTARPTVTPLVGFFSAVFTARPTVSAIFRPFSPRAQRCPPPGPGGDSAVSSRKLKCHRWHSQRPAQSAQPSPASCLCAPP